MENYHGKYLLYLAKWEELSIDHKELERLVAEQNGQISMLIEQLQKYEKKYGRLKE